MKHEKETKKKEQTGGGTKHAGECKSSELVKFKYPDGKTTVKC